MDFLLTTNYKFVMQFDTLAAEVYLDRKFYLLSFEAIASYRGIPSYKVMALYSYAVNIIKEPITAWMYGLSGKAKKTVIEAGYTGPTKLCKDVLESDLDLEDLPKVGHGTAIEIRRWCLHRIKKRREVCEAR